MKLSAQQYLRFLFVGGAVGLISLLVREALGYLMGDASPVRYSISVIAAYAIGVLISFALNRTFTFEGRGNWSRLPRFTAVALIGIGVSWVFAVLLRYGLPADRWFGARAPTAAFAASAVLTSLVTYPLNALLVFKPPRSAATCG
jgi:putative flippase GtrA